MTGAKGQFKTMAVIEVLCVLLSAIIMRQFQYVVRPKAKLAYDCLRIHEGGFFKISTQVISMILASITILEMVIYGSISYHLYKHDKFMKVVLGDGY